MGLLSCLAPKQQEVADRLRQEVEKLTEALVTAQQHLAQLQAERTQLLHDVHSRPATPNKHDAATEMPTVSVAVQVKPPVTMESRIPRPTGEEVKDSDGTKSPIKSRIPAPPIVPSATVAAAAAELSVARSPSQSRSACRSPCRSPPRSPTRSMRQLLHASSNPATGPAAAAAAGVAAGQAVEAAGSTPASPRAAQLAVGALHMPCILNVALLASPKAGGEQQGSTVPVAQLQRVEVLQQQLKVAEAFRLSLEAELRDARFANTNLQTQMLNLQTKFEKMIEEQVSELERLNRLRKEGQDGHEQAIQQVHALKHKLSLNVLACASAQREADLAARHAVEQEQQLQQAAAKLASAREELSNCMAEVAQRNRESSSLAAQLQAAQQRAAVAEQRVQELEAAAQQANEAHRAAIKHLDDELRGQKAIYDSTVEEMLQLNNNYNELKQAYHKLQSETRNHDEMVHLVQQELSELSYYAAAGRVALGVAPLSSLANFRPSEVSMGMGSGGGAVSGEEYGDEAGPGVRVSHGAVLLSDGRLQLADGRARMEIKCDGEMEPKMRAAVIAVRALSGGVSSEAGPPPAGPAAEPGAAPPEDQAAGATPEPGEAAFGARLLLAEAADAAGPQPLAAAEAEAGDQAEAVMSEAAAVVSQAEALVSEVVAAEAAEKPPQLQQDEATAAAGADAATEVDAETEAAEEAPDAGSSPGPDAETDNDA